MISVINPSQLGNFAHSYLEFHPYHLTTSESQRGLVPETQETEKFQFSADFPTAGNSARISGCVQSQSETSSPRDFVNRDLGKDYSKPLFVDCSIEYELPITQKIPKNSAPILMIPPFYIKNKFQQSLPVSYSLNQFCDCQKCFQEMLNRRKMKESNGINTHPSSRRKATKRKFPYSKNTSQIQDRGSVSIAESASRFQFRPREESVSNHASATKINRVLLEEQQMFRILGQHQTALAVTQAQAIQAALEVVQRPHLWPPHQLSSFQQITPPGLQDFWQSECLSQTSACCCCPTFSSMILPPARASPVLSVYMNKSACPACVYGTCSIGWNKENIGKLRPL